MRIKSDIDEVSGISDSDFKHRYFIPQRPVIIRRIAASYPAGKKWTLDHIGQRCGHVSVELFDGDNRSSDRSALTSGDRKMKFADYLRIIRQNDPPDLKVFLFNMFGRIPGLRDDFPCPSFFDGLLKNKGFMFFGAAGKKLRMHYDIDLSNVLLTQFAGRKHIVLAAPEYSPLLYQLPFNTHTLADPLEPDLKKYPALKYVDASECTLYHGDALFMPAGYWHFITYLDTGFSVSYRKLALNYLMRSKGLANIFLRMPFDKLMNITFGNYWMEYKTKAAERTADRAVARLLKARGNRYSFPPTTRPLQPV